MRTTSWAAAIVVATALAGCNTAKNVSTQGGERPSRFAQPTPVKVERRDIVGYALLAGQVYVPPGATAVAYPPYHAPVERVFKNPGDHVNRGEPIMDLSLPDAEAAYQQSKMTVQEAQTAYDNAKAQYNAPVKQARTQLDQARSTERTLRRQAGVSGDGTELQQAEQQRLAAEQALQQAEAEYKSNMLQYQQQLDQARGVATQTKRIVRQGAVRSPISGTVVSIDAKAGQDVGQDAKQAVAQIADLGAIQVKAIVPSDQTKKVALHSPVVLVFAGLADHPIDGHVSALRSLPDANGAAQIEATIDFKNDKGFVKPGIQVERVGVKIGEAKDALAVPVEAVAKDSSGTTYVMKQAGNDQWTKQPVTTGLTDGSYIAITSGLEQGDTVRAPAGKA